MVVFTLAHVKFSTTVISKRDYCIHVLRDDYQFIYNKEGPNYFQLTNSPEYPGLWTIFYKDLKKFNIYRHYDRITAQQCVDFFNNELDIETIIVP